ncbi:hydrogenase [Novosphingobium sp. PC22D]|uniref:NrfD/PsrC family molybdoenzyme membrane anchor subunit n=1 Tax=Novosphingobium sp. PC22D TaxID=1962403 RepID=UPI000BF09E76|nr:NrfD/PsrC family molybdoenzyme membrane anchor subunit [Novosphingobium sp. PC22D]PEQ13653.1 hydrogenase [Novosphingobium sp. PC22D]
MTAPSRYHQITGEVVSIPPRFPAPRAWWLLFAGALALLALWVVAVAVLLVRGPGVWGNNIPVGWGFPIIGYVWWLGIGHAGTLISSMLLLLSRSWRNSLNRFAEAMTLFAVVCAGLLPILHLGRPWYFYWMAPYPNTMGVWPQFRSPLAWDFFAVVVYLVVSVAFWYVGIIPDLASARDRATKRRWQFFFGLLALGWRGAGSHWLRWRQAYRLTAALAIPLVALVTASYALLFAGGPVHGWNSTIFPAYFLVGAVFSGFAVVGILAVVIRSLLGLRDLITPLHFDRIGKLLLATGLMTLYGYLADAFTALYGGGYELETLHDRVGGAYAWSFWGAVVLNFVPLQFMWRRRFRTSPIVLALVGVSVAAGMWLERYMLVVTGLFRDWTGSSTGLFHATFWDWALFAGFIGVFATGMLLFVRLLPVVSAFEIKREIGESGG